MKNLIVLAVVALFSTTAFSQDAKTEASPAAAQSAESKAIAHDHNMYMAKGDQVMFGSDAKWEAQKETVTLKNGTMLMANGEWKTKDGKSGKLTDGQCVDMMGNVGDCEKMKASHNHMKEDKK